MIIEIKLTKWEGDKGLIDIVFTIDRGPNGGETVLRLLDHWASLNDLLAVERLANRNVGVIFDHSILGEGKL